MLMERDREGAPPPPRAPAYTVRLRPEPGVDGIRALRAALKYLLRRHRLRCISAREKVQPMKQLNPLVAPDGISGLQVVMPTAAPNVATVWP